MDNEIKDMFNRVFVELDKINNKFTHFENLFDKVDTRLDNLDSRMDNLDSRMDKLDSRMDKLEDRIDVLEVKQDRTSTALEELKFTVMLSEKNIRRDILMLKDAGETVEQVLKIHRLIPV